MPIVKKGEKESTIKNDHPDLGLRDTANYAITDQWKKYEISPAMIVWIMPAIVNKFLQKRFK
jgi:hypothetical protein